MKQEEKQRIFDLQTILLKIDTKQPIFFNITKFQSMGLIKGRNVYGISPTSGNKVRIKTNWYLTDKGKRILNVQP